MKKFISMFLAVLMVLSLVACGGSKSETSAPAQSSSSSSTESAAPAETPAESVTLKFNLVKQPTDVQYEWYSRFWKDLEEASHGEIVGEIYTGESLGVTADVLEQAANGEAVVADCDLAYLANYVPDMAAVMSPYLIQEPEVMNKLWPSDVFQDLCSQLEAKGLHLIALNYEGSRSLWTKTPITCRDDVGKLKIRCASTTMWNSVVETLGGNPTNIPMSEVYQAVSQGVVDGCEGVFSVIYSNKVYEVLKYCTLTEHLVGYTAIVMSSEIYNNLSPEAQAALDQTAADYMNEFMELSGGVQDEYRAKLEAEGVTVNTIDKAEFIEASANVPKNFPEWTPGILDELKAVLE